LLMMQIPNFIKVLYVQGKSVLFAMWQQQKFELQFFYLTVYTADRAHLWFLRSGEVRKNQRIREIRGI